MALCDLAGKILDTPVYNLLGGAFRDRIRVYLDRSGVADPTDLGSWRALAERVMAEGFNDFKFDAEWIAPGPEPRPLEPPDAQRPGPR